MYLSALYSLYLCLRTKFHTNRSNEFSCLKAFKSNSNMESFNYSKNICLFLMSMCVPASMYVCID